MAFHRSAIAAFILIMVVAMGTASCGGNDPRTEPSNDNLSQRIEAYIDGSSSGAFNGIRAVLVTVKGKTTVERYYSSSAAATSNIHSVTKSVMSTLIGIAIDDGRIRDIDQTLAELLPRQLSSMAPPVKTITLRQILTMTAGFPAEPPYGARDWVASILGATPEYPPGERFAYSNAGSHLLSAILVQATGRSVLDYAREKLFTPLNISTTPAVEPIFAPENLPAYDRASFAWPTDPQGIHLGFNYLKLTARDMAKLGELWLNKGRWDGKHIVSESWTHEATRAQSNDGGYGYHWWIVRADGHPGFAAIGHRGQLVEVIPELQLVVVLSTVVTDTTPVPADPYLDLVATVIAPAL